MASTGPLPPQVDVDLRSVLEAIHAGTYRPDTNGEPPLEAIDTISQVWPQKPSNKNLHVFVTILRRISRPTLSDTVGQYVIRLFVPAQVI